MDNGVIGQSPKSDEFQQLLSSIIRSLQEEDSCPSEVQARFKELEGKADVTMENLPEDLKWIVSLMLDRDDALIQNNKYQESEKALYDQLMTAQQQKEKMQVLFHELLDAGVELSVISNTFYENLTSLRRAHFTSGSEKASNIRESIDEEADSTDDCEEAKTQNSELERLVKFFSEVKSAMEANTVATSEKDGRKRKKNQETTGEASGEDLLEHLGEEISWESQFDEYKSLKALLEMLGAKPSEISDEGKKTWARCEPGHLDKVVANVEKKKIYHNLYGEVSPDCPPEELEINGLKFKLIDYDTVREIIVVPVTVVEVENIFPKYKVSLKGLNTENRNLAIVILKQLLGRDVYVDGAKKAFAIVSTERMQDSFSEEKEEATADSDGDLSDSLMEEDSDIDKEEEKLEESDENEETVMSSVSSEQELGSTSERPIPATKRKSPEKMSRRAENKEKNQKKAHQVDSSKDGEEDAQENIKKKEDAAQRKRECERQRHEQKKQEKAEKKKAANSNYKPSKKRTKQRMETFAYPASHKKPTPLISGKSYWSPSLVAYVLFLSLSMMLPIYRIECASAAMLGGLNIPLSTLESLSLLAFDKKLKYLLPYFYKVLEKERYIHADETVLEVFREKLRKNVMKSYIWIYSTIVSCTTPVRIYDYKPGRKGAFCKAMLASFVGVLITDAYQGYNLVEGVQHAFCFIHARRKIYDAAQNGSSRYARKLARRVLLLIDELFDIERNLQAAGYDPETLAKERQKQMSGILAVLKDTLIRIQKDKRIISNGKLAKAANYMLSHYDELTYFLKDGNVPMHNQVSEHAARRVALYRNNSMFCGSPEGAEAFAGILTVAETARANNLDVYKYFLFLLENMRGDDFWKDEELMESLLPWSEKAQTECATQNPVQEQKVRLLGGKTAV